MQVREEQKSAVLFRVMRIDDIDKILEVEHASFTTPWTREAFYYELTQNDFAYYLVAELAGEVVGYCGLWMIVDEGHITNIAIHPKARGQKLGERLLVQMMTLAVVKGAKKMTLEVRVSNLVAQNLYKKLGFEGTGLRKKYYPDNYEDALIMWVNLDDET